MFEQILLAVDGSVYSMHATQEAGDLARRQLEAHAAMNTTMQETLNIGGALLVKLFGRVDEEVKRFD